MSLNGSGSSQGEGTTGSVTSGTKGVMWLAACMTFDSDLNDQAFICIWVN